MIKTVLLICYGVLLLFNLWIGVAFVQSLGTVTEPWSPAFIAYSSLPMVALLITALIRQYKQSASGAIFAQVCISGVLLLATWLTHLSPSVSGALGILHVIAAIIFAVINVKRLSAAKVVS
jgi:hypothetical protein